MRIVVTRASGNLRTWRFVFDGSKGWYEEGDTPNPVNVYGRTKVDAEEHVLNHGGTVVRLACLWDVQGALSDPLSIGWRKSYAVGKRFLSSSIRNRKPT